MYVFHRLNSVEDLMANAGLMADVKDVLKVLPDLERLLKKYVSGIFYCVPVVFLFTYRDVSDVFGKISCYDKDKQSVVEKVWIPDTSTGFVHTLKVLEFKNQNSKP